MLEEAGVSDVRALNGGFAGWQEAGLPVIPAGQPDKENA